MRYGSQNQLIPTFFLAITSMGAAMILQRLIWSFMLDNDYSGQYDVPGFSERFWSFYFVGAGLFLVGCFGSGWALPLKRAVRSGAAVFALGFVLIFALIPFTDFEGWTGASAWTLIWAAFGGGFLLLIPACLRWLWQKLRRHNG